MKFSDFIGQIIFNFARAYKETRACLPAGRFEGQQKSFVIAMIFAVSCFAVAERPIAPNQKIEKARQSILRNNATTQSDIRRDLAGEKDPAVRARLVSMLAHTTMDKTSLAEIRGRLGDIDPAVRAEAVIALAQSGDKNATLDLRMALLNDRSEGVRMAAAFWLGGLKDPGSIPALAKALASDRDPHVRAQAAHSLKWIGTTAARNELKKGRADKDGRVRKITSGF